MGMDFVALPGMVTVGTRWPGCASPPAPARGADQRARRRRGRLPARRGPAGHAGPGRPGAPLIEVCDTDPVRVGADTDITDVAVLMTDYNLITIPVVDDVRRLLGAITVDDVLEIALPPDWRRREAADAAATSRPRTTPVTTATRTPS